MRHGLQLLILCLLLAPAAPAAADFRATDDRPEFILLSTSTTTAVAVGVIMLTVVNVRKDPTALQRYLQNNEPAVRAALALGAGAAVYDIAPFFGVSAERAPEFGRLLRRHRSALMAAAFSTDEDVTRFARLVEMGMRLDPALRVFLGDA